MFALVLVNFVCPEWLQKAARDVRSCFDGRHVVVTPLLFTASPNRFLKRAIKTEVEILSGIAAIG